ncbi:hypothetical protein TNCV_4833981 [Trichonephila clavipes]|nr:hypothetical protein TNCV_4833981 [Trichonephila clavipes]
MGILLLWVETDDACCLTSGVRADSVSTQTYKIDINEKASREVVSYRETLTRNNGFTSDSDVQTAAENWLNGQGPDYYQDGLNK